MESWSGINTFIISNNGSFAGAGFAIPSQIVRRDADQIIKTGSVQHGYMGISMNDVTPDNASFFKVKDAEGAIVAQVTPDSPAANAGLKSGDVIRELNGQKVTQRQRPAGRGQPGAARHYDLSRHPARWQLADGQRQAGPVQREEPTRGE